MKRILKLKIAALLIASLVVLPLFANTAGAEGERFTDVPAGNWADKLVHEARRLNITQGKGNNAFGYGEKVKRCEFVKFLVSLMGWELLDLEAGSFHDNLDKTKWYYKYIETALANSVIINDGLRFRPDENITREEMAVMIARSLGYDSLARQLVQLGKPFSDVDDSSGYITIVKDFGIVTGKPGNKFDPHGHATREEAIAMLMRMHEKLNQPLKELHAFYAIQSYSQIDMLDELSSVSFGWSRLEYDHSEEKVYLNTTRDNQNEYGVPDGFQEPVDRARESGITAQLMVTLKEEAIMDEVAGRSMSLSEYLLTKPEMRIQAIGEIISGVLSTQKDGKEVSFDGVVIDFECMNGEALKNGLNAFVVELRAELDKNNIDNLYVAVHPKGETGWPTMTLMISKPLGILQTGSSLWLTIIMPKGSRKVKWHQGGMIRR